MMPSKKTPSLSCTSKQVAPFFKRTYTKSPKAEARSVEDDSGKLEGTQPARYQKRADEIRELEERVDYLRECEHEVEVLTRILSQNCGVKMRLKLKEAAALQHLVDVKRIEAEHDETLRSRLADGSAELERVENELQVANADLEHLVTTSQLEVASTESRLEAVEKLIKINARRIADAQQEQSIHREKAARELAEIQEEIDKVHKNRTRAWNLRSAAQRNLDSFASALKSIENDIAGGANPRIRVVEQPARRPASSDDRVSNHKPQLQPLQQPPLIQPCPSDLRDIQHPPLLPHRRSRSLSHRSRFGKVRDGGYARDNFPRWQRPASGTSSSLERCSSARRGHERHGDCTQCGRPETVRSGNRGCDSVDTVLCEP